MQAWRASVDEQRNPVFVMDKSGVVTVAAEIDLEDPEGKTKTQYKFKVTASNTKTSEASFCWLLIHVNDVNDNEPVFGQTEYKFEVHESTPVRTIVGSVDVTDKDLMDQANLRLSLIEQGTKSRKSPTDFTIDKNGRIMTHRKLDREQIASYKFYVIAKDSQSPIHQSQVKIVKGQIQKQTSSRLYLGIHNVAQLLGHCLGISPACLKASLTSQEHCTKFHVEAQS